MSKLFEFLKENIMIIIGTILIYQLLLTIFCFSTVNLVLLAGIIVIVATAVIITTYKDTIIDFFKRK